jgi:hypothetical protein
MNDAPPRPFRIEAGDSVMTREGALVRTDFWSRGCLIVLSAAALAGPARAKDPGQEAIMVRMLSCTGPDAAMEVYIPEAIALDVKGIVHDLQQPVIGYYTLDLTSIDKGKPLEPVKISMTADGKTVIVNQYTRGLPPTRIPVGGGTVDFDQRFGTGAKCGPFQAQDPNFRG